MKKYSILVNILLFTCLLSCSKSDEKTDIIKEPVAENWYKKTTIAGNTFSIEEPKSSQGNVSYLIEGDTKAIMIDTGSGENKGFDGTKMMYFLKDITELPITLILSLIHI